MEPDTAVWLGGRSVNIDDSGFVANGCVVNMLYLQSEVIYMLFTVDLQKSVSD